MRSDVEIEVILVSYRSYLTTILSHYDVTERDYIEEAIERLRQILGKASK